MFLAPARTMRYVRSWVSGRGEVVEREVELDRDGTRIPTTLVSPARMKRPVPGWIVLHGISRPGRRHAQLVRFTHAMAASGLATLVPEVPEWRALDLAPRLTGPTVRATLAALPDWQDVIAGPRVGLVGFSFGAPQVIAASGSADLRDRVAGTVGFGGYYDIERTVRFQFTGRHEWGGREHRLRPDPYGRWIVGANYLTAVPGLEGAGPVAEGLRSLAARAGDVGVMSWAPELDPAKRDIGRRLSPEHRELLDLFAPPAHQEPDPVAGGEMSRLLAQAARTVEPAVEPGPLLSDVGGPVHLLHGRDDHLIPFSEGLRLKQALPPRIEAYVTVTRLFAHAAQDALPGWIDGVSEGVRFLRALSRMLDLV